MLGSIGGSPNQMRAGGEPTPGGTLHRESLSCVETTLPSAGQGDVRSLGCGAVALELQRAERPLADFHAPPEERACANTPSTSFTSSPETAGRRRSLLQSNAPEGLEVRTVKDLRYVRHRPKFQDGEPVEQHRLQYRRHV